MPVLVKIKSSDDGELRDKELQYWHLVHVSAGSAGTFCEGEFFGEGESGCAFELKEINRGGITCPNCISKVKWVKAVKL